MLLKKRIVGFRSFIDPDTHGLVIEPLYEFRPVPLV